jgi:hypothetical protein
MKVTPLLLLPFLASGALAFDVWSFRSGMSEEQATAVARQQGFDLSVQLIGSTKRFHSVSFSRSTNRDLGYIAAFCDGRLNWLSHRYTTQNMGMLFEVLNDLRPTYGAGSITSKSTMTADGRVRLIEIKFPPKPGDVASISVILNAQGDTDFGFSVIHEIAQTTCQ